MAWTMTLKYKEIVGNPPNRQVRIVLEVTDGNVIFPLDFTFQNADEITLNGLRRIVQNIINREADLLTKNQQLDSALDKPFAVFV